MGSTKNIVVNGSGTTSISSSVNLATFSLPSAGSWLINVTCGWGGSGAADTLLSISTASGSFQSNAATALIQGKYTNFSYPITVSASTTMYIVSSQTSLAVAVNPISVFITRIG